MSEVQKRDNKSPGEKELPSTASSVGSEFKPGSRIGSYKLLSIVGEGGFALVYLAEQEKPVRRRVALKVIKPGMDSKQVISRFEAERQALALLNHPNVAHVYDAGTTEAGYPYFVMEYVKGMSLTQYCDRQKLTIEERINLFLQVCEAVQHAHQKGIIHRDIKPSNIQVCIEGDQMVPKVIDFGIAKALSQPLTDRTFVTEQGQMVGTPEYMSPEQAEMTQQDIDTRTDIYSLGVLLYELLTGTLPFEPETLRAGSFDQIRQVIRDESPRIPSTQVRSLTPEKVTKLTQCCRTDVHTLQRKIRGDLDWITFKAMEKDRIHRYQTAHAMAEDIQRHLNHEPVLAGPPSKVYRLKKFIRKHRPQIIWSVTVAILLATVVALAVLWVQKSSRDKQEKYDKEKAILSKAQEFRYKGHFEQARIEVEKILNSENVGPDARLLHARIIWVLEGPDRAEEEAKKLLQEKREIAAAAYAFLARIYLEKDPNDPKKKEECKQIANNYQREGERLSPTNAEAHFNRALMADIVEETLKHLNDALELDSQHYDVRRARALAYYALRRYHKMQQDVAIMLYQRDDDPLGYSLMAIALRETGEFKEALKHHDKAIDISDTDPELYSQRYETYLRMGKYQRALKDIQRCVELEPEQPIYHFDVFNTLVSLGDYQAARKKHRAIIDTDPTQLPAFEAWATRHVFQVLGAGQPFELPADIAGDEAFYAMQKAADYYHRLEAKAVRLVPGVYGQSSWSPKEENKLAYGLSDLYTRQYKMLKAGPLAVSGSSGIEIRDIESGTTRLLVSFGKDPAWSPDGQHIAFVREPNDMREYTEEVWIISAAGEELRRLATGAWPMWAADPKKLFYHSRLDKALYSIRIDDPNAKPERVISCPSRFPWISPDENYVAYAEDNELRIVELPFGPVKTIWTAPLPASGMLVRWSPNGKEISAAGLTGSDLGLWIFDVEHEKAWQIFDPPAISGIWSPNMSQMVIEIKIPFEENWLVTLDHNVPIYQSIASALTCEEYLRDRKEYYMGLVKDDPNNAKICIEKLATVGLSQYDLSLFNDAFMTFTEIDNLHRNLTGESRPVDLKFIVMALHRLGLNREAEDALTRLRGLFESGKYPREEKDLFEVEKLSAGDNKKFYRLWEYIGAGQLEEASQLLEELCLTSPGPDTESATKALARAYYNRGKKAKHRGTVYDETIADYKLAVRFDPNFARAFTDLAWLQAACPVEEPRDSTKAIENATKACEVTGWKDHHFVGALAAVCAEVGNFAAAAKWQKEAIELLNVGEHPMWLTNYEMRLKLYESDKRYDKGSLWSFSTGHMVAWWKLDEKSGGIAADSSGNNCAGTLAGNLQWRPSGGKLSGALEFDGDGDYIRIGNESIFDFTNEITVAAWVNITTVPEMWTAIVTKGNSAWRLSTYRKERKFHFAVTGYDPGLGSTFVHGEKEVAKGQWHHVCGTYDGAYVRLYIDGVEDPASRLNVAAYSGPITSNDFDVCIGENSERPGRYWHGLIDDVRIYSYALSRQEIKAILGGEESNSVKY